MSRNSRILPLPLFVHYAQTHNSKGATEADVSDMNGIGLHLEKVIPMRIFGTILEKNDDGTISFRWANDTRNLDEYQKKLNAYYAGRDVDQIGCLLSPF